LLLCIYKHLPHAPQAAGAAAQWSRLRYAIPTQSLNHELIAGGSLTLTLNSASSSCAASWNMRASMLLPASSWLQLFHPLGSMTK
jgi:hypothetical protein